MNTRILRNVLARVIFFMVLVSASAPALAYLSSHDSLSEPDMARPAFGSTFQDSVFGTKITSISKPGGFDQEAIMPEYSKRQAWNSDNSYFMLRSGNGRVLLYNASNYTFIKALGDVTIGSEDVFWNPLNPKELFFAVENKFYSYNVDTDENIEIYHFTHSDGTDYAFADTLGEGNISRDGKYYALAGRDYVNSNVLYRELLLFNISSKQIVARQALPASVDFIDWVSVSPNGNYIVVDYANTDTGQFHGVEVYDKNFNLLWQKPLGAGHSDLGIDGAGNEVLIMDIYNETTNVTEIKKFKLSSGDETKLLELSPLFDLHESCRDYGRPGWCYVSTFDYVDRLTDSASDWLPFEDEIFALKTDGSGTVERLVHHYSRRYGPQNPDSDTSVYFSEPHATANEAGTKIFFASNWRRDIGSEASVNAYVIDLTGGSGTTQPPSPGTQVQPGLEQPFSDISGHWASEYIVKLHDACGIEGYKDSAGNPLGLYYPDRTISRAELTQMIVKCAGKQLQPVLNESFPDVGITSWYAQAIDLAKSSGWVSGYPDGNFYPDVNINRAESLKIILRSKFTDAQIVSGGTNNFQDVETSSWYEKYVLYAVSKGYASGYKDATGNPTGYFGPANDLTRAEAAKIITIVYGLM